MVALLVLPSVLAVFWVVSAYMRFRKRVKPASVSAVVDMTTAESTATATSTSLFSSSAGMSLFDSTSQSADAAGEYSGYPTHSAASSYEGYSSYAAGSATAEDSVAGGSGGYDSSSWKFDSASVTNSWATAGSTSTQSLGHESSSVFQCSGGSATSPGYDDETSTAVTSSVDCSSTNESMS